LLLSALPADANTPLGSAYALYNPLTGALTINASNIARVTIRSTNGNLVIPTDGDLTEIPAVIDHPDATDLSWFALSNSLNGTLQEALIQPATPLSDLMLEFQQVGGNTVSGTILVVPEPTSHLLMAAGLLLGLTTLTSRLLRVPAIATRQLSRS